MKFLGIKINQKKLLQHIRINLKIKNAEIIENGKIFKINGQI